ncbi:glycosyltransferase family 2 protein [Carboxylicivirga taeanensis]|uniref:glycosyltransferase family 2 protein n=1 Tax=Carboxylicivirga taeanensis TaxID=1416875 RepID=UPI003F6DC209
MCKPQIELSIIIVSFHAIDFLKLTLDAVEQAIKKVRAEVILIDNSNNEHLRSTVQTNYKFVRLLPNQANLGFAKANNLGLKCANGQYALLLNPDTIVAEDTFIKVLEYYSQHPQTGGLGVKMIDGTGHYLKESKRGFPDLKTSFFKLIGAHQLFPKSKLFAKYYCGYLSQDDIHLIDVLSGAFLLIPRDNEGQLTLLNESYFMYGEDIDLSCSLKTKHGTNVYFPLTSIIHFKGQSTNVNPVIIWHFYHAMWLFYQQHIFKQKPFITNALVWLCIKVIIHLRILSSKIRLFQSSSQIKASFSSACLLSENKSLHSAIEPALGCKVERRAADNFIPSATQLLIFDFKYISYKQAIEIISSHPGKYAFITQDNKSLIICAQARQKGQVIHLK